MTGESFSWNAIQRTGVVPNRQCPAGQHAEQGLSTAAQRTYTCLHFTTCGGQSSGNGNPSLSAAAQEYVADLDAVSPKGWTPLSYSRAKGKYGATEEKGIYPEVGPC